MPDGLQIDATEQVEHYVGHLTQGHADAWDLWYQLFDHEKAQFAHARYRIEQYFYPLLPEIEIDDVIIKCFYNGADFCSFSKSCVQAL